MYGTDFLPILSNTKPEPIPRRHMIYGWVVRIDDAYGRDVRVSAHFAAGVVGATAVARAASRMLGALVRTPAAQGPARKFKDLRKGPEFQVTQVWLTDIDGTITPVEVHGHLSQGALVLRDRVRISVRRQRDPYQPPRVVAIENLSTGRTLKPRGANIWSHLGPALILQALVGVGVLGTLLAILLNART
ncbi:hypothetical protein GCM10023322_13330 [Rugosimonospora acidiphila]|uniref:Uncharacterized protein n=1 Tax=Rugosimonospora acidiphila TaxID=556531 RepID=A0ABP9RLT0_9ACTN